MHGAENKYVKFARSAGNLYTAVRSAEPVVRGLVDTARSWVGTGPEGRRVDGSEAKRSAARVGGSRTVVVRASGAARKGSRRNLGGGPPGGPRSGKTRRRAKRYGVKGAKTGAASRRRVIRTVFDALAPRNELITQSSGQIRTSGTGVTAQGNQQITILSTPFSVTDLTTMQNVIASQQGAAGGAGSVAWSGALYSNIRLDNVHGMRTRHEYEFVNPGNQDVHFRVWWFKCKTDFVENSLWTTLSGFIDYATSTTFSTALGRTAMSYTGTYTNVTNPYHVVGWHPNLVPNRLFKRFFRIKVGPKSIIRPGGHKRLRVPLGKGARTYNVTDNVLAVMGAAGGKLIYRKGDIIPIIVTYGDIVHGSNASTNTTTVSTGSVTLDYVRVGHHVWQAIPEVAPQQYFGGANLNQTTALGGGVTLADAAGVPAVYSADA